MIIGNIGGFIFAGIVAVVIGIFWGLFQPTGLIKQVLCLIAAIISFPIAIILELCLLKPRLFFIPVWILSLIFIILSLALLVNAVIAGTGPSLFN